ncbi:hypothetical protein PRI8871_02190 [Pseudoprimorskyibacter insulae]|uniref:Antifreeze glycopeptide polyprotein n=1 Tax=Pseudoprimorskyibacter insulae TaxID=1695997 RepID=A0A2R8AWH5_9RHOB|nr:hypothetical protein PRI8871_02190 [Pseudoprimorskyibacter insulae]
MPLLAALACPAQAQDPLSAIDWLGRADPVLTTPEEPPVSHSVQTPEVAVSALEDSSVASVGLLPSNITGLPPTLWRSSRAASLAAQVAALDLDGHPDLMRLLITLLLAEAEPPEDAGDAGLYVAARVRKLIELGALDPARALIDRAGPERPTLFPLWFDLSLLAGDAEAACASLDEAPHLMPDPKARIYCAAQSGDWMTAVTILQGAVAIGDINPRDEDLLSRFLDAEIADTGFALAPSNMTTPLEFRLYEAIGDPLPTASLPRAFAAIDLGGDAGWKAQIESAERLARVGVLQPNMLVGIYTARRAAASGGVWDRVKAVQALDTALTDGTPDQVAEALLKAWPMMAAETLLHPFGEIFGDRLAKLPLSGPAARLALKSVLLSSNYELAQTMPTTGLPRQSMLAALAQGRAELPSNATPAEAAVLAGFSADTPPNTAKDALRQGLLGEVILRAMAQFGSGAQGNWQSLTDAIATFRYVGLEQVARRASLHLLVIQEGRR